MGGNKPAKSKVAASTVSAPPAAPAIPPMPAMHGMPPFGYPYPAPYWMPPYQTPTPARVRHEEQFSSPPEMVEDSRLFPRLTTWLKDLDADQSRGADDHNFAQFAGDFERERYMRVVDLEDLKADDLRRLIPEMASGTATKILSYVKTDVGVIRKREKKRARKDTHTGPLYTLLFRS